MRVSHFGVHMTTLSALANTSETAGPRGAMDSAIPGFELGAGFGNFGELHGTTRQPLRRTLASPGKDEKYFDPAVLNA
jgi:hypothetical protein